MKIVYIAHPIGGDVENNLKDLVRIIRHINLNFPYVAPIAPYYADIVALNDSVPEERERGIQNDIALIKTGAFEECWLTGNRVSTGMDHERQLFISLGIPVINWVGMF